MKTLYIDICSRKICVIHVDFYLSALESLTCIMNWNTGFCSWYIVRFVVGGNNGDVVNKITCIHMQCSLWIVTFAVILFTALGIFWNQQVQNHGYILFVRTRFLLYMWIFIYQRFNVRFVTRQITGEVFKKITWKHMQCSLSIVTFAVILLTSVGFFETIKWRIMDTIVLFIIFDNKYEYKILAVHVYFHLSKIEYKTGTGFCGGYFVRFVTRESTWEVFKKITCKHMQCLSSIVTFAIILLTAVGKGKVSNQYVLKKMISIHIQCSLSIVTFAVILFTAVA